MEAQKAVDKLEDQIENLNSKIDDIENQLIEVHGNIRKVTSRMNATELGEKLSKKKIYLMDLKEKLQKDLKVAQKEKTKLEISISLEKNKRFPVKHPNMPYIETAMEKMATDDDVENESDYDDANEVADESDDKYANFVPHPNISLSRDSEYMKKIQNKPDHVPHPNIRKKGNRDCESAKVPAGVSFHHDNRKINSMPAINRGSSLKCNCIRIDKDILQRCESYENCQACLNAIKAFDPDSKVGCPSKISFAPEAIRSVTGKKPKSKVKGASSMLLNCKSYNDCPDCALLIKKTKSHLPECNSYDVCKHCAELRDDTETTIETEMSETSNKSSYFEDSCASFKHCRDCEIARQVKKVEAKRKIAETPKHRHCSKSFCIPFFVQQCSHPCSKVRRASLVSIRPVTAPIFHNLQTSTATIQPSIKPSKSLHKLSVYSQSKESCKDCNSQEYCKNCQSMSEKIPIPQELHVYQTLLNTNSLKSVQIDPSFSSPKIPQESRMTLPSLCQSYAYCQNCNSFAPIKQIPTEMLLSYENAMKACNSVNTCKHCQQLAISTVNKRHSIDVSTSDNDGVDPSTSELKKIIRESLPDEKKNSRLFTTPAANTSTEALDSNVKLDWRKSSILNKCSSFGVCAKCMESIWQQTVVNGCTSEPECKLCSHIMESIDDKQKKEYLEKRALNLNRESKISRSMKAAISRSIIAENSSFNFAKTPVADDSGDSSKSYEQMKQVIEKQNDVIRKIQDKIRSTASRGTSEESVRRLTNSLGEAKVKLRKLVQLAMIEQKKHQDENWKPITVSLIDDY